MTKRVKNKTTNSELSNYAYLLILRHVEEAGSSRKHCPKKERAIRLLSSETLAKVLQLKSAIR